MSIKPIKPSEIADKKREDIPESVINCWNTMIARNFNSRDKSSNIKQDTIIKYILEQHPDITRDEVFDNHWLDIEDIYREAGWKVEYEKCIAWAGDTFESNFTFTAKSQYDK